MTLEAAHANRTRLVNRPKPERLFVSDRLLHLRDVTKTTQSEISGFLCCDQKTYANYERDSSKLLPTHRLMRLPDFPKYQGLSLNWLLRGEGESGIDFEK